MKIFIIVLMFAAPGESSTQLVMEEFDSYDICLDKAEFIADYVEETTAVTASIFECVDVDHINYPKQ